MKFGFRMSPRHFIILCEFFWLAQNDIEDFENHFGHIGVHLDALENIEILEEYPEYVQ